MAPAKDCAQWIHPKALLNPVTPLLEKHGAPAILSHRDWRCCCHSGLVDVFNMSFSVPSLTTLTFLYANPLLPFSFSTFLVVDEFFSECGLCCLITFPRNPCRLFRFFSTSYFFSPFCSKFSDLWHIRSAVVSTVLCSLQSVWFFWVWISHTHTQPFIIADEILHLK